MDKNIIDELAKRIESEKLNCECMFASFKENQSNKLARQLAHEVAEKPGEPSHNPFIICGEKGVGKTYLLHAIGNHVIEKYPDMKVRYVTAETFIGEALISIAKGEVESFRKRYAAFDVLMVDDLQMFVGKSSGLSELNFISKLFVTLEKQIIFACTISRSVDSLHKIGEVVAGLGNDDLGVIVDINQNGIAVSFKIPRQSTIFVNKLKSR